MQQMDERLIPMLHRPWRAKVPTVVVRTSRWWRADYGVRSMGVHRGRVSIEQLNPTCLERRTLARARGGLKTLPL